LARLVEPLDEALAALHHGEHVRYRRAGAHAAGAVLRQCADSGRSWWGWAPWEWARLCGTSAGEFLTAQTPPTESTVRPYVVALAYLLGGFSDFHRPGTFNRLHLACLIFGEPAVDESLRRAGEVLDRWGYRDSAGVTHRMRGVFSQALLLNHSPRLDDLDTAAFAALRAHPASDGHQGSMLYALQRVIATLGYCDPPVRPGYNHAAGIEGTDPVWAAWIERWYATSTLTPKVRAMIRTILAKAGRWLAAEHPEITEPGQWTRATCAAWVAAVDRMSDGDWVQRHDGLGARVGEPISPRTKAQNLVAARTFFRDCQEWEWIPRRFDPNRALAVPRSIAALIGTNPRVIADDVWAKLLWAGLNLQPADLPGNYAYYPMELIRAVTLTWLFSGLRSDEITRLRVGCIRWQHTGLPIAGDSREVLAEDAVCLLDVPVHKTGTAFTKPVDPLLGQAINAWQVLRPDQPKRLDRKTADHVHVLFSVRAQPVAKQYINHTIIPALCAKAGVPTADVRGNITSHRARSTIASPALQRQGADDALRAAGLARTPHPDHHPALRQDHPEHTVQGLFRGRILRPQRPQHRGPHRPRRRHLRRSRRRPTLAALRPRPRLVQLQLLRTMPAPNGLRPLRFLHPQGLDQSPAARGQG
jgi:integrase